MIQALVFVGAIVAAQILLVDMYVFRGKITQRKLQDAALSVQLNSAIEATVLATRMAEARYVATLSAANCNAALPFVQALKNGSQCAAAGNVTIYSGSDVGSDAGIYAFGAGCVIQATGGCAPSNSVPILTVKPTGGDLPLGNATFRIFFVAANPTKEVSEFLAIGSTPDGRTYKNGFAIRTLAPNLAHLEGDGRVTQENPDPLSKCAGTPWGTFSVWDATSSTCRQFAQLGSGTGLGYYAGRYFGFRPPDGQVIDLLAASTGASYLVANDGTVGGAGAPVFPAYDPSLLINADDITVLQNQIYFVSGGSGSAQIQALVPDGSGGFDTPRVCDLAGQGWSQSYSGIAALSWGDPPVPAPTAPNDMKLATFLLKTDSGDLLTAEIIATAADGAAGPTCYVFKDATIQQIEYKRTLGFDRTDDLRAYYTY